MKKHIKKDYPIISVSITKKGLNLLIFRRSCIISVSFETYVILILVATRENVKTMNILVRRILQYVWDHALNQFHFLDQRIYMLKCRTDQTMPMRRLICAQPKASLTRSAITLAHMSTGTSLFDPTFHGGKYFN